MSRLVRMDASGHTALAEWTGQGEGFESAARTLEAQLELGYIAVVDHGDGKAEQVRELPVDAPLVILRRPIAGG